MKFLFLLYCDEEVKAATPAEEVRAVGENHHRFEQSIRESGQYVFDATLAMSDTATSIRDDVVTDGPFVEAREQLGGLYVVECADLDEAVALAKRVPESTGRLVEIRPVLDLKKEHASW